MDELRNEEMQDEELERYGVWVKAGPEEVVEADDEFAFADLPADGDDFDSGGSDEAAAPETERTDSADLDADDLDAPEFDAGDLDDLTMDDFDTPELDEPETVENTAPTTDDDLDDFSLDDLDDLDEIDTPAAESIPLEEDTQELTIDTAAGDADDSGGEDDDLVSLDDLDIEVPEEEPDPFGALQTETPETAETAEADPDVPELDTPADDEEAETAPLGDGGDLDLEEITEELPDDFEAIDLDVADPAAESEIEGFDSSIPGGDDELQDLSDADIAVEESSEELPELEIDDLDVGEEHDFTPEAAGIEIDSTPKPNRLTPDEEEFLDEEPDEEPATDFDLQNEQESGIPAPMDVQEREAFERIQTELSDIKKELADLKAALRAGAVPAVDQPAEEAQPIAEVAEDEIEETDGTAQTGPGFFEEEEDETIALTGDELDNILNTAEFTEEVGEAEELEDDYLESPAPVDEAEDGGETGGADFDGDHSDGTVDEIDLEPVDSAPVVIDGDESAVDELAEMDIDSELADIEGLTDDTESSADGEIEIDLESIDDVDTDVSLESEEADLEAAAEMDQQALADDGDTDVSLDDLEVDDEDIELEEPQPEPETETADTEAPDDEAEGFDDFAAAVEEDIAEGEPETTEEPGVELDVDFDDDAGVASDESAGAEAPSLTEDDDEIEIDLDDIDGLDDEDLEVEDLDVGDLESDETEAEDEVEPPASFPPPGPSPTDGGDVHEDADTAADAGDDGTGVPGESTIADLPDDLKQEIRSVLSYMDQLLEALPDDKIEEFAHSEHFEVYKRLFEELGLET